MKTTAATPKLERHTLQLNEEGPENDCAWCGSPAYVGDTIYVPASDPWGSAYCSPLCAMRDQDGS